MVLIGLLQAQSCLSGYDASAHLSEETKNTDTSGPMGMISAVVVAIIVGWLYIISIFLGIHDYESTLNTPTGFPVTQILYDNFGRELTLFFMTLLIFGCWLGGITGIAANSRMIYAFSRDNAMVSYCIRSGS